MEDTKKTVLAGNGEKDVPRAVYDGVLTIDVDAQVESMEEQEEARWHQLLNAEQLLDMMDEEENALQKIYLTGYVLELKKNRYFAGWYKDRIVCRSLEYARYFPSAEAAEEYVHKYLGFAGMTCYVCHVNWTLASCGSENMEDNEENLLEENGKILSFANYADVKQYQKQRGMEHSTMAITYASRKKKIILAA